MEGVQNSSRRRCSGTRFVLVLRNCGFIDPEDIDHYLANDGYIGLANALGKSPEEVTAEVKEAGLRGRGRSRIPTHCKWKSAETLPEQTST